MTLAAMTSYSSRADSGCGGCATCSPLETDEGPFSLLVSAIRDYLGQSSGIDAEHVDPEYIKALMARYTSNPKEWEKYARADKTRNYTRNLVDNINGNANLVSWPSSPKPSCHNH